MPDNESAVQTTDTDPVIVPVPIGDSPMPGIDLNELFCTDAAEALAARRDDTRLATARQRDGSAQDMRVVGGMLADELLRSNEADKGADRNAAARNPTTLDHPGIPAVVKPA
jgi:hypothetical protein